MKYHWNKLAVALLGLAVLTLGGCYSMRPSSGGGQTDASLPRRIDPADVAVPRGYRVDVAATGLTFPTGVAFDRDGVPHIVEAGYSYGEVFTTPRLLRVNADGGITELARGSKNGPWTGVAYADGAFYVAEGGQLQGGRILRITGDGEVSILVDNLPSLGDHHTNGPAIAPDGTIYFGQGTATNSAVVGADNLKFGWLRRFPDFHDVPCQDVALAGRDFETTDVPGVQAPKVRTGAYVPFGTTTAAGQIIKGQLPCSGAIMRVSPSGRKPELVAWGFRNPFGLAFAPDGALYVTDNGYDDRGSRPVWGTPDVLWRVTPGTWYGWPDYSQGLPVTLEAFKPPGKAPLQFVLARHPNKPPRPAAVLAVHASSNGMDFSRSAVFGHAGEAFIAEFGDMAPGTGKVLNPVGFRVIRVNVTNGRIHAFAVNKGEQSGPASKVGGGGLERPTGVRFDPSGNALYVVDFGVMLTGEKGPRPLPGTGVLWRITRGGAT